MLGVYPAIRTAYFARFTPNSLPAVVKVHSEDLDGKRGKLNKPPAMLYQPELGNVWRVLIRLEMVLVSSSEGPSGFG